MNNRIARHAHRDAQARRRQRDCERAAHGAAFITAVAPVPYAPLPNLAFHDLDPNAQEQDYACGTPHPWKPAPWHRPTEEWWA